MAKLHYKLIREGLLDGKIIPLNIVFVDSREVECAGISQNEAILSIAEAVRGPVGINIFDMDAVTTTSDGILIEGAIVRMGAGDNGRVHPEFGILAMAEIPYSEEIVAEEPHLIQWKTYFPDKKLYRGPDPKTKLIPVHNVTISGRAANNNSATEMMNIVTMEEILLPILGQLECMRGGNVVLGYTGEVISVGIGMTVAERFGRVFPNRQFYPGDTAHGSGEYSKTLKRDIPCIVAAKRVLAENIIRALECGCVPGREISCSPAVLAIARAMHCEIAFDRIAVLAWEELASVGITKDWLRDLPARLTRDGILAKADDIIPGVGEPRPYKAADILITCNVEV